MRRLLLLAAALAAAPAAAQGAGNELRPERLYLNPTGVLLGSTRTIALGGAYVGVAEGASGFTSNLAALAQRSPYLDRDWDLGFALSWLDLPFVSPVKRDLDNDGVPDQATESRQFLAGVMLQYKQFGIGTYWRDTLFSYCKVSGYDCRPGDRFTIDASNLALAGAVALGRDDFIAAVGLYNAQATIGGFMDGDRRYGGTGLAVDALYRPHGLAYRVGLSVRPQVVGAYGAGQSGAVVVDNRRLYSAVVSPAVVSLGGSVRLGEGAGLYNRYSTAARRDILKRFGEAWAPEEVPDDAPAGSWLVTAQLDFISATESTVPLSAFVDLRVQTGLQEAELVGRDSYLSPHLGAEHDTIPGRLRSRVGTFLEPSPFRGRQPRVHVTGGLEVFLYDYWDKWSVSTSVDFAQHYYNVGLSVGFWR